CFLYFFFFFFQAEDGIRDLYVTGVQTCALPICPKAGESGSFAPPVLPGFLATTSPSAPAPRIGTLILVGPPLGFLPSHRGGRFPRSAQEPALDSRRLHAGHHASRQQAPLAFGPGPTNGARFR